MRKVLCFGFCILVCSIAAVAQGTPPPGQGVPEIDAGSLSTALALAGGGLLLLRSRFRSR